MSQAQDRPSGTPLAEGDLELHPSEGGPRRSGAPLPLRVAARQQLGPRGQGGATARGSTRRWRCSPGPPAAAPPPPLDHRPPGRGTGSSGRTSRSPTAAPHTRIAGPGVLLGADPQIHLNRPAPRTSTPRPASQACQPSRSPAYERRVRAKRSDANHAAASNLSRPASTARAGSSARTSSTSSAASLTARVVGPAGEEGTGAGGGGVVGTRSIMARTVAGGVRQPVI